MDNLNERVAQAVQHFWTTRLNQSDSQGGAGARDMGGRAAVTGGRQMDGFVALIRDLVVEVGCPTGSIHFDRKLELPGWFRAEKQWDLAIIHKGQLLAAAEFKSQIGPSFGNNFNNRTEEALGSATDIWAAYREGAFKPSTRPWLGYLMLLEDCSRSASPVKVSEPHFKVFEEFRGASYRRRYQLLLSKLVRERLYDSACFLLSPPRGGGIGAYSEPDPEFSFLPFTKSLMARVSSACQ